MQSKLYNKDLIWLFGIGICVNHQQPKNSFTFSEYIFMREHILDGVNPEPTFGKKCFF
jgi:hypothetical protein